MARQRNKWDWTPQKEEAATLIAAAALTNVKIAAKVGVSEVTLYEWIAVPDFAARVEQKRVRICEQITRRGIAVVENRVARKQADWEGIEEIKRCRAALAAKSPEWSEHGGETGLILHDQKSIGSGLSAEIVDVYRLDTSLLAAQDRLEDAVAIELGQRVQKQEIEVRDGAIADELESKLKALAKRHGDAKNAPAPEPAPEAAPDVPS